MKIGIIGCGYIGRAAAHYWQAKGHTLLVTTRHASKVPELQKIADEVVLLTTEPDAFDAIVSQVDAILLSVAPDHHQSDYEKTYLQSACNLYKALQHSTKPIHLLYTSSTSVYGEQEGRWVQEDMLPKPMTQQSIILLQTEIQLLEINRRYLQHKVCIFRLGEIIGPDREMEERLKKRQEPFPGDGSAFTNIIHREDVVSALDFSLGRGLYGLYNLCNDLHILRKELYQALSDKHHLSPPTWDQSKSNPYKGNKRISNTKIKDHGYQFLYPLAPLE